MTTLSVEQLAVVNAPLDSLCVVACAGSGKTHTAVQRVVEMRRRLGEDRGRVALLSFSNIAVETFQKSYRDLAQDLPAGIGRDRVDIDTLDGFITTNILRPHAYRTMRSTKAAFLVSGSESFLAGFTFKGTGYPLSITKLDAGFRSGTAKFHYSENNNVAEYPAAAAVQLIERLSATGAYTHSLGRYWCHRVLNEQPAILEALVRRYPHILVDEAQDIGTMHQAILEQLAAKGVKISLIGDPSQGIYEFAGADGKFLSSYGGRTGITSFALTSNYRSVPGLVALANTLSQRTDTAARLAPATTNGAFFIGYKPSEQDKLISSFRSALVSVGLSPSRSAVLCRGRESADKLSGAEDPVGVGAVKLLAEAAILRDKRQDYLKAFHRVILAIVSLLEDPPPGLVAQITQPGRFPQHRALCRLVWAFTRDPAAGLPSAFLVADTDWFPALQTRVKAFMAELELKTCLERSRTFGNKLTKKGMPNEPLAVPKDLADVANPSIRVDTVHQVKGESLDGVLYMASAIHVRALLAGVQEELGRIGYVAATRARDLFWLAVPQNALSELRSKLLAAGFQEVPG
jgi:superfamily I DNA/RNA helicase